MVSNFGRKKIAIESSLTNACIIKDREPTAVFWR